MKIRLVGHASVIVECRDVTIWTDPWLFGKVFNDSWTLLPEPAFDQSWLHSITHLWLSHEHPDHFHLPTLSSLPVHFKENVQVLFQERGAPRAFATLEKLGFRKFVAMPHRARVRLGPSTEALCYYAGTMDSCLGVKDAEATVFNINDSRINRADCRAVLGDLGSIDALLSQFSLAVTNGESDNRRLAAAARHVLESLSANHRDLEAKVTIPFASLIYWSAIDNRHVNAFANRPREVFDFCARRGQSTAILYPGEVYEPGRAHDSQASLAHYARLYTDFDELPFDCSAAVPFGEIAAAFDAMVARLRERFPRLLLHALRPLTVLVPDLGTAIQFSIAHGWLRQVHPPTAPDLCIYSQPLHFCFAHPYGAQTLAISGRYTVRARARRWRMHRALFALNNAGVSLRLRHFASRKNWTYLRDRILTSSRYRDRAHVRWRFSPDRLLSRAAPESRSTPGI